MSEERSQSPPYPPSIQQRRASFSPGASLSELFTKSGNSGSNGNSQAGTAPFPSPITSVAANAQSGQRRRLSITTLGLSGSPTQPSQFAGRTGRQGSLSSSVGSSSYLDEAEAVENENSPPSSTSPFARRFSFGAQALRDARGVNKTGNGRYSSSFTSVSMRRQTTSSSGMSPATSSPAPTAASTDQSLRSSKRSNLSFRPVGEAFNWSESLRTRAERTPSVGASSPPANLDRSPAGGHHRSASIASMDFPAREMPKQPRRKTPDFFQEKILRADFMD
ncbi:conserved hypothetical protein [Paecilomyces variotii No. 5]|uniref:Uncharacterized protein n=1 Tax=Byssochlamys spectabilis (strain No. 5 / NBRC 109023) TaxID=1356009 RepID=V5G580_BYSSN|nr:conserved hypothetical protein [Paecilomyces variotii No. 5]